MIGTAKIVNSCLFYLYSGWAAASLPRSFLERFVKHTKTGNPLVDSVAEHQPAHARETTGRAGVQVTGSFGALRPTPPCMPAISTFPWTMLCLVASSARASEPRVLLQDIISMRTSERPLFQASAAATTASCSCACTVSLRSTSQARCLAGAEATE